jgi:hypothetical protein
MSPGKPPLRSTKGTTRGFDDVLESNEGDKNLAHTATTVNENFQSKIWILEINQIKETLEHQLEEMRIENGELKRELLEISSMAANYKIQMAEIQTYRDRLYLKCSKKITQYKRILHEKTVECLELGARLQMEQKRSAGKQGSAFDSPVKYRSDNPKNSQAQHPHSARPGLFSNNLQMTYRDANGKPNGFDQIQTVRVERNHHVGSNLKSPQGLKTPVKNGTKTQREPRESGSGSGAKTLGMAIAGLRSGGSGKNAKGNITKRG